MQNHCLTAEEIIAHYNSTGAGLSSQEANKRILEYGPNKLEDAPKKQLIKRIWEQIKDPMILVLLAAALISGAFKEIADMVIIFVVVIINTILGIVQENKAENALKALQDMTAPHTKVKRDHQTIQITTHDLVPGDIVIIEAGDSIPADLRLLESHSLKIEEAALTGESVPTDKDSHAQLPEKEEIPLGDRVNMAYMGTNVVYGRGLGMVVNTGMQTEMGKIASILANTKTEQTPLQKKLASLSKVLSVAVLAICVFIFLFSVIQGGGFSGPHVFEAFLTAVSLAVAAIPEGLVVVVTVMLSIGVTKMSTRNAIIRRLTAVETLGCTQVICSDKTGTLTQNKMSVIDHIGDTLLLAEAVGLCNDSQPDEQGGWLGDPTETALAEFSQKQNARTAQELPRVAELPFDSNRKMMSTVHQLPDQQGYRQYTKGAPDEILMRCEFIYQNGEVIPLSAELRANVMAENQRMASKALRVLGGAFRDYTTLPQTMNEETAEQAMVFIGLTGMIDPVRPEVKAAIVECQQAGIQPIMITGDHKDTAVAIAQELGILQDASQAISGSELAALSDAEFEKRISQLVVYARVQPEHKVRIVKMWQKLGKITAMTGDGVNDAPALKSADIGVGMGITGTDVTKNVADMVLTDDNFATIVYAVEEGRRIYENIRKAIQFLLASNLSEVVAIFAATLAGARLFAPIHILWINLITDTFPAMALGMERAEKDVMQRPPRNPHEAIFADGLGKAVIWQGVTIALLTLCSFFIGLQQSQIVGMTMAFLTLSMCEIFHSFNMRSRIESIFKLRGHNKYLFAAMLFSFVMTMLVIYVPGLNTVFKLTALPGIDLLYAVGIAFSIIPIVELVKLAQRKYRTRK